MIAGLILAAGESSRMGADKALLAYCGRTFLETICTTLHQAGLERITVVLGHHAEEIRHATELRGAELVVNENYAQGQTSSLQAGLKSLATSEIEAIVLCLVDHPAVSESTVSKLVNAYRESGTAVVIPTFQKQHGHPVLISRLVIEEMLQLGPEAAANAVIRKHRGSTQFVEVDDPGILLDVDDEETYRELRR